MDRTLSWTLAALTALLLTACGESNDSSEEKPEGPQLNLMNFRFEVPDYMEFTQGVLSEYELSAVVPGTYTSTIKAENLPEDASFENAVFSWQPSCTLSPKDGKFKNGYWITNVRFTLRLAEDPESWIQESSALIVHRPNAEDSICGE